MGNPADWRSLPLGQRTVIFGVVDVSEHRVGQTDLDAVVEQGRNLIRAGADALDVSLGGFDLGTSPVQRDECALRVLSAVEALRATVLVPLAADVIADDHARAVLTGGASVVRYRSPPASSRVAEVAATAGAALILGYRTGDEEHASPTEDGRPVTCRCRWKTVWPPCLPVLTTSR